MYKAAEDERAGCADDTGDRSAEVIPARPPTLEKVNRVVTAVCGKNTARSKAQSDVFTRHIAMYLMRKHCRRSLPQIGRFFGGMHHTTVLHGIRKIERRLNDPEIAAVISYCEELLFAEPPERQTRSATDPAVIRRAAKMVASTPEFIHVVAREIAAILIERGKVFGTAA